MSQGSAATYIRRGGKFYTTLLRSLSLTATVKELLKFVYLCQSYRKNKSVSFFTDHSVDSVIT